jgi:pyruvate formate lyase activating enzyme
VKPSQNRHSGHAGKWWHKLKDGRIQCDLCPRDCKLKPGQRGFCFVRQATPPGEASGENSGENSSEPGMELTTYGRSSGFFIDPIEKKPLNHFYPGTPVLSFGTAGCNLACKFCQNWDISKAKDMDRLANQASPENIAQAALDSKSRHVAFTYNDPVIFAEYAIDTAIECRKKNINSVAVTAGYIREKARSEFFDSIDAVNIDLKAFTEDFYWKQTGSRLKPVLETIDYVANKTKVWLELTTLLIPGLNDNESEIKELSTWINDNLGPEVPLHFSAFHPDYKIQDRAPTSPECLTQARAIAMDAGLHFVYTGNVHDPAGSSTYCPRCKSLLIERDWYELGTWNLKDGCCNSCGHKIAGHFEEKAWDLGF